MTAKINAALKEESLAIEKKNNKEGGAHRSAHALQKELDSVKEKIQRHNTSRKAVEDTPGVKEARDAVVKCYRDQPKRTLDCYREVKSFTDAVEQAERVSARGARAERDNLLQRRRLTRFLSLTSQNFIASLK